MTRAYDDALRLDKIIHSGPARPAPRRRETPIGDTWHEYVGDNISGVVVDDSFGERYVHGDIGGNLRLLTDGAGAPVQQRGFTAFGETLGPGGAAGLRYAFGGAWGYQDDALGDPSNAIGALHVGARYYDPVVGRFLQRDPVSLGGGINLHVYAENRPTIHVDPSGLMTYSEVATAAGIGAALGALGGGLGGLADPSGASPRSVCAGIVGGAASGAAVAFGPLAGLLGGAVGGGVSAAINGGSWADFAISVSVGGAVGLLGGFAGLANDAKIEIVMFFTGLDETMIVGIGQYIAP